MGLMAITAMAFAGENVETLSIERSEFYVGVGGTINETYTHVDKYDPLGHTQGEFSNGGGVIIVGKKLDYGKYFDYSVEARFGTSLVMEDSEDISTRYLALYLRPEYPLMKHLHVYGLLGGEIVDFDGDNIGESFAGFSFGLGAELVSRKRDISFFIDYTKTLTDADINYFQDNVNFDTFTMGVRYAF